MHTDSHASSLTRLVPYCTRVHRIWTNFRKSTSPPRLSATRHFHHIYPRFQWISPNVIASTGHIICSNLYYTPIIPIRQCPIRPQAYIGPDNAPLPISDAANECVQPDRGRSPPTPSSSFQPNCGPGYFPGLTPLRRAFEDECGDAKEEEEEI